MPTKSDPKSTTLKGVIQSVRFRSSDGDWAVLDVLTAEGKATVVGSAPQVSAGEELSCVGHWSDSGRFGRQFKASSLVTCPPTTCDAIERYLASGAVEGISRVYAKKLVNYFGERLPHVIEHNPSMLECVPGIGPDRRSKIAQSWSKQKTHRDTMIFLQQHRIGARRAAQICKRYGAECVNIIRSDPYRLSRDIPGIGFQVADEIARTAGLTATDPRRIQAGIREVIHQQRLAGHCAVVEPTLARATARLTQLDGETVSETLRSYIDAGRLAREDIDGRPLVFAKSLLKAETQVAERFRQLANGNPPWNTQASSELLAQVEREVQLELTRSQRDALSSVLRHKVSIITGGPGSGKTTLMRVLAPLLKKRLSKVVLAAPTGRAARRLSQATGMEACTIHRLLMGAPGTREFRFNRKNPLDADVVLVDEMSMNCVEITAALLNALPDRCALIGIGDVDQLPSVGPGQVLSDLLASNCLHCVRLVDIHRQAKNSKIVVNAHRINERLPPLPSDPADDFHFIAEDDPSLISDRIQELVCTDLPRAGFDPMRDVQLLTPMRKGLLGTHELNARLQQRLNGSPAHSIACGTLRLGVGDRVIQQVNNYDLGVFNGDTGFVSSIDNPDQGVLPVTFEDSQCTYAGDQMDELALAYALTVHKSQGSEYPAVVMPIANEHYVLLNKRLLYTALTRGRRKVIWVGQERALTLALKAQRGDFRVTGLASRLRSAFARAA